MKKLIAFICVLPLIFSAVTASAAGFNDVASGEWYYNSVTYAADNGIVNGKGGGIFDPEGTLSVAEAVKLACGIYARKNSLELPEQSGDNWYDAYFAFAAEHGFIAERPENPDAPIAREMFASFINAANGEFTARNKIADSGIRDVATDSEYAAAIYTLYRAGVLTGSDEYGRFFPERTLTRAEACEIIMRVLVPSARKTVTVQAAYNPADIFKLCADAVFSIETFDEEGYSIRTGSGFFISSNGLAVTNLHVLQYAHSAIITTTDGNEYELLGVAAYSADNNVAIMQTDGSGFNWLPITSSDDAKAGQEVYSIGNPLGLDSTISRGIISFVGREEGGRTFLQFTASISQGSGGGALVDSKGYVIGITSSSYNAGSLLNLATPSKFITDLIPGELTALTELIHAPNY